MTIPIKRIFFKTITFKQSSKEYLEAVKLKENIKSQKEMSLNDIEKHQKKLDDYINELLIEKQFISKECVQNNYFLINCSFRDWLELDITISLNFESYQNFSYNDDVDFINLRKFEFFNYFANIIEKQLKEKLMNLGQEQVGEQAEEKKIIINYKNISYKNLNDLNSAKFLTDNEKRMILGLPPINNENK